MALFTWSSTKHPHSIFITFVSAVVLYLLFTKVLRPRQLVERETRDTMDSAAEHIDPAAMDLTPLVNTLINSSQSGSRQLFSLLSVTSYSSLALHKLTLLVYNISNIRNIESQMLRRRFCYCVTNETNDLTDFAAILLDVMENSTSYVHELFKSASIVSVSQRNNSECIYICVMAGKMGSGAVWHHQSRDFKMEEHRLSNSKVVPFLKGRKVPDLWDVESISPLFNKTIVEGPHRVANISSLRLPIGWHQLPTNLSHISPSGISSMLGSRVQSTAHAWRNQLVQNHQIPQLCKIICITGTSAPLDKTAPAMVPQTSVVQPLASGNTSNATPQRSQMQDTTVAGATVSRTTKAGATVSRTTKAVATVSRTTEAGATVPRTTEAVGTVTRTTEAGATVTRTTEAVSRTTKAGATVTRTTEAGATVTRTTEAGATVTRTTEAGTTVSRTTKAGATVTRTTEAGATVTRTTEAGATVTRTTEAGTTVSRTTEAGATVTRTTEAGATVSRTTKAGATVSRTTEAGATVTRTTKAGATVTRTTEAGATVTRTTEAGTTVSRTTKAGATVTRTTEAGTTVSRTTKAGATVSRTTKAGATVTRTTEAGATVSRTTEAGVVTPALGPLSSSPAMGPTTGPPPSVAAQPKTEPNSTPRATAWTSTKHFVTSSPIPTRLSTHKPTAKHTTVQRTTVLHSWRTTRPIMPLETEKAGCPWKRPESTSDSIFSDSVTTVSAHKLQPCVFELCKFFSQCLCRPFSHQTRMKRYCDGSHIWYEKHTFEVCRRVRRISFSRNLKQRCLRKMCNNL